MESEFSDTDSDIYDGSWLRYPELHPIRNRVLSFIELPKETQKRIYWLCRPTEVVMEDLQDIRENMRSGNINYIINLYETIKECVEIEIENLFKFEWNILLWALEFGVEGIEYDEIYTKISELIIKMGATPRIWEGGNFPKKQKSSNNHSPSKIYLKYIGDKFNENHKSRVKYNLNMYSLIDLQIFPEYILETNLLV